MPTDVHLEVVSHLPASQGRRIPVGLGLTLGALVSVALWTAIGLGLNAVLS